MSVGCLTFTVTESGGLTENRVICYTKTENLISRKNTFFGAQKLHQKMILMKKSGSISVQTAFQL